MSDKKKMPVDGGGVRKGKPDGVSATPGSGEEGQVHGRFAGGESAGGAYPSPNEGKASRGLGDHQHGGQSEIAYYGGGNPNATAGGSPLPEERAENATPVRKPQKVRAGKQSFDIVEDSGVAAAEATGKLGTDASYGRAQEHPGSD